MKRGKDVRNSKLESLDENAPREVQVLAFTLIERSSGAYSLRFVCNEDLIRDLQAQGSLDTFLEEAGELFNDFRERIKSLSPRQPQ